MGIGGRVTGWATEGLSLATAAAVVFVQTPVTQPAQIDETLNWLIRALLGISLAMNTYFLKKLSDNVSKCTDTGNELDKRVTILERSYEAWLESEREERNFDRREHRPGRRAEDMLRSVRREAENE